MVMPTPARVITFYSYKGGVGRTMALANLAHRLAETHGLDVLAVDWDLEAPGLHPFFGIPPATAATTLGVLDYFIAWRDAVKRKDPEPPPEVRDVTPWFVPVEDPDHRPRSGSISVLLAGRQDRTYDERLASLHWQDFYVGAGGALAVERLREQLVAKADVVLVDSRTGLTDAGGICTIQLPDGVVLMTAPSAQSLEGTESVARTITRASATDRAGREHARVWLAVGRFSSVEETDLAARWFKDRSAWFEKAAEEGLWSKEDHPEGLQSHVIPHRGRWNFGEAILREGWVDARDPLMMAYGELTETLVRWLGREVRASPGAAPVDFLLITAIEQERDALLRKLPGVRKLDRDGTGAHTYFEASIATRRQDGAVYRVVVMSLSGMGPVKGAIKVGAVIQRWKPAHVLMVGIAGGIEGEVAPGDVMVASQVADYTVGKVRVGASREDHWTAYPADADLLDAALNFSTGWEDLVSVAPPEQTTPTRHVGVVASGGDVIASKKQLQSYRGDWPKLIGVEMEGASVAAGLHDDIVRPRFLMIRGVSDLADGEKSTATKKAWRSYACHVAAAYAIGLLRDGPVKAAPRGA
jgi:nucleoside phosphorylase/CO dehydrogenase nickel-insertion accessory protein CooC1